MREGVLYKRVASKGRFLLYKAFGAHTFESGTFDNDKSHLRELSGEEKTTRMAGSITLSVIVDVAEEWESLRLDIAVLVHCTVGYVYVTLLDGLVLDTAEVDSLLLRVILDDFRDREAVDGSEMLVCCSRESCCIAPYPFQARGILDR